METHTYEYSNYSLDKIVRAGKKLFPFFLNII